MLFKLRYLAFLSLSLLLSCKKEVEKIVVQDRQYSWAPTGQFTGFNNVILGIGQGPQGLYMQQPGAFTTLTLQQGRPVYQSYLAPVPTDVNVRLPIGPDFFVTYSDTTVTIIPTKDPVYGQAYQTIRLKRLDQRAQLVPKGYRSYFKMGAINVNRYLLFPYLTTNLFIDNQMHLVLAQVPTYDTTFGYPSQPMPTPRVITLPVAGYSLYPSYPTLITAIDNYFLVDCGNQGVYRIEQNGTYRQVLTNAYGVETFYKWQGRVYAHMSTNQLGVSDDNGLTWQITSGASGILRFNSIHPVGDSLVGIYHAMGNNLLFTLKVNSTGYRARLLKNDGIANLELNGLETWRDTVFLATSGGLFKKPVKTFFESQPK
ncbi:hypothetical protein ACFST9_05435 [Hymenobacter monticola]|uniref:DUF1735 domain-containing protein n=1 Tax=Hymenobacter monticola TaxID=1705399 RepID=A0ABY4BEA2_9BACT|nr:hypothetical protein [Hymenobacter monticola]UOE36061.1 hypothetical protein MTP16_10570 [Hymenobacter monticola]